MPTTSFPFFDLARRKGVPYGLVLRAAEGYRTDLPNAIACEARRLYHDEVDRRIATERLHRLREEELHA